MAELLIKYLTMPYVLYLNLCLFLLSADVLYLKNNARGVWVA